MAGQRIRGGIAVQFPVELSELELLLDAAHPQALQQVPYEHANGATHRHERGQVDPLVDGHPAESRHEGQGSNDQPVANEEAPVGRRVPAEQQRCTDRRDGQAGHGRRVRRGFDRDHPSHGRGGRRRHQERERQDAARGEDARQRRKREQGGRGEALHHQQADGRVRVPEREGDSGYHDERAGDRGHVLESTTKLVGLRHPEPTPGGWIDGLRLAPLQEVQGSSRCVAVVRAPERTRAERSPVSTESPTALRTGLEGLFGMGSAGPALARSRSRVPAQRGSLPRR
jgi:hypothetical protein